MKINMVFLGEEYVKLTQQKENKLIKEQKSYEFLTNR